MKEEKQKKILIGLKKAQSSLGRIIEVLEESEENGNDGKDEKCFSVIQQSLSVIGLLKSVNTMMLENHISSYIKNLQKEKISKRKLERMKEEILKTIKQAQR